MNIPNARTRRIAVGFPPNAAKASRKEEGGVGSRRTTGNTADDELRKALVGRDDPIAPTNPLAPLYARFTEEQHCQEIARLLTPHGMKAEVVVVYQTVENLRKCLFGATFDDQRPAASNPELGTQNSKLSIGDWYFTGDYPTPGGYRVLRKALLNYLERKNERPY